MFSGNINGIYPNSIKFDWNAHTKTQRSFILLPLNKQIVVYVRTICRKCRKKLLTLNPNTREQSLNYTFKDCSNFFDMSVGYSNLQYTKNGWKKVYQAVRLYNIFLYDEFNWFPTEI